jgi:DNA-binding FrmR family transcriptional regulator
MGHLTEGNDELLKRVRRIAGQVTAIEKALAAGTDCTTTLHLVAAPMWRIPIFRPRSAPQGRKN